MQYLLGHAAKESVLQSTFAVRAHNDNIDIVTLRGTKYLWCRMAVDNLNACDIFQVFWVILKFFVSKHFQPFLQAGACIFFMLFFKRFKLS